MLKKMISTVALAVSLAAGTVVADDINITVVSHGQANDPFWTVVKNGVEAAGKDMGVKVDYRAPETFNMVEMAALIDAAVNQEPDGLVVSIPDGDALGDSIRKAVAAGIPVISMNSGSNVSAGLGALLHVGQEERDAGRKAGQKLKDMGGKKGLCVNHEVGNVSLDQRCEGFKEGFGKVTVLPTTNDPADVKAKVRATLEKNPDIDSVLALNSSLTGEPTLAAVEEVGMLDKVKVSTFDMSANFLQAIAEGKAAFAIDQQQYLQGYLPVAFLAMNAKYGLMPGGNVPSGPNLITQGKAAQVVDLSAQGIR